MKGSPLIRQLQKSEFPKRLQEIPDPPKELFIRGTFPDEDMVFLAVVGSRKYTPYGKEVAEKLIAGIRGLPVVIVSGLALGIDGIAHRAALHADLKTVAIPGSGLAAESLYPSSNRFLADEIVAKGGALLSEFPPEFRATQWSFPQRNRIMAGLSDAVLVIEAEKKSGTLITSRLATDYNRDVLTVPGSIFSSTSEGPHMLIRNGATPIGSAENLKEALGFATEESNNKDYSACSKEELRIISFLTEPKERETLIAATNLPIGEANALLSMMEIKGIIEEKMGKISLA